MSKTYRTKFQVETYCNSPSSSQKLYQKGGPTLPTSNEIFGPLASLADAIDAWERAAEEATSKEPKRFTFNGTTYEHIPGTETFKLPGTPLDENGNPIETLTALQIMKQQFPNTRSLYRRIVPTKSAEDMFLLGDSARFKIMRAVQLHYITPPVTAATKVFTPLFNFLSEGVEDHWMVQQQYSSCKWASPKDQELATSMLLHFGWVQKFPNHRLSSCCIYQMRRADDGIHFIISEPHSFNDRLFAGCTRAHAVSEAFKARNKHAPYDLLFKEACRVFFSYNRYYISMTSDYRQAVMNKIQAFCLRLTNALAADEPPLYPSIDQPENIFEVQYDSYGEPYEYILKWEDFILEDKSTTAMKEQRQANADNNFAKSFLEKIKKLNPEQEYSSSELRELLFPRTFKKACDAGYFVQTRRAGHTQYYKLNYERS